MRQAYHAISLGFYEGELLRRVDPQHRSLGQFFDDEIASPLGLDLLHSAARNHTQFQTGAFGNGRSISLQYWAYLFHLCWLR